jgi:glyoxylase-like metal-dependent hydrolase (beta-lactamase superfamily II)
VGRLLDEVEKRGWRLKGLWLTHGHFDHVADHGVVRERFGAGGGEVLIHEGDVHKLREPGSRFFRLPFVIPAGEPTRVLRDGDRVSVGRYEAEVMHTPGHSPGHVCYYFEELGVLVGGDLIIAGAIGRTDFPDCSAEDMQRSLQRVMRLPAETRLLPGHGEMTTLGDEAEGNEYVQMAMEGRLVR